MELDRKDPYKSRGYRRGLMQDKAERIRALRAEGLTWTAIAQRFNLSAGSARKILERLEAAGAQPSRKSNWPSP